MSYFLLEFTLNDTVKPLPPRDALEKITSTISANKRLSQRKIVLVYGPPGIGKTWVAHLLKKKLDEMEINSYSLDAENYTRNDESIRLEVERITNTDIEEGGDGLDALIIDNLESLFTCPPYEDKEDWAGSWKSLDATSGSRAFLKNLQIFLLELEKKKKRQKEVGKNVVNDVYGKTIVLFVESFAFYLIRAEVHKEFKYIDDNIYPVEEIAIGQTFGEGVKSLYDKINLSREISFGQLEAMKVMAYDNAIKKSNLFEKYILSIVSKIEEEEKNDKFFINILNLILEIKENPDKNDFVVLSNTGKYFAKYDKGEGERFVGFGERIGLLGVRYDEGDKIQQIGIHRPVMTKLGVNLSDYFTTNWQRFYANIIITLPIVFSLALLLLVFIPEIKKDFSLFDIFVWAAILFAFFASLFGIYGKFFGPKIITKKDTN